MRGKTPSCAGLITVRSNAQEELRCIPFYGGIMINWAAWSTGDDPASAEFAQGVKDEVRPNRFASFNYPEQKPYFQIIKTKGPQVSAGIWRKFLNLKPGHTYQISARLNTLRMGTHTEPWSYSFHAAYDESDGRDFTVAQLAGVEPLPDGQVGKDAGRIVSFGTESGTLGKWVKYSTAESGFGVEGKNITLPTNVNSLTVWVRHSGSNSSGVGVDWVRIEDLGLKN
jgi:hypothetical protein